MDGFLPEQLHQIDQVTVGEVRVGFREGLGDTLQLGCAETPVSELALEVLLFGDRAGGIPGRAQLGRQGTSRLLRMESRGTRAARGHTFVGLFLASIAMRLRSGGTHL